MHRSSPYGYQSGKGSKDHGKNKPDYGGKGRKDYGKGSMSSVMLESMSDRIVELERICERLKLENDRLKEDYQALLENERELEVNNEITKLENDRLQTEICRLQSEPLRQHTDTVWLQATDKLQAEVDRLQIEFDCMVAANKRLRHGITKHAEQASKLEDSLNELAYPYATIR